jgi:predicted nuclease with RNAse H fold
MPHETIPNNPNQDSENKETALLSESDLDWLSQLANRPIDPAEITNLNIDLLQTNQHYSKWTDQDAKAAALLERKKFFEGLLNWGDENHPLHQSYEEFLKNNQMAMPLDTTINTLRFLKNNNINVYKVVNTHPTAISYNQDSIKAKLDNYAQLGIDGVKVVNTLPAAIGYNQDSIKAKLDNYAQLGIDGVNVVNALPSAIGLNQDSIKAILDNYALLGIDGVKVVNTLPAAIGYNQDSIKAKLGNYAQLGIDGVKVVNTLPAAINYNQDSVKAKLDNYAQLGIDGVKVVNTFPQAITLNQDSIKAKLDNYAQLGIDGAKVVNALPSAIGLNQDNIALKVHLLKEKRVIDNNPDILNNIPFVTQLLIAPLESLLAAIDHIDLSDPCKIPSLARKFMKNHNAKTAPERKEYITKNRLELAKSLGKVALAAMRYTKTIGDEQALLAELEKS